MSAAAEWCTARLGIGLVRGSMLRCGAAANELAALQSVENSDEQED
jgi:hypothetical protein